MEGKYLPFALSNKILLCFRTRKLLRNTLCGRKLVTALTHDQIHEKSPKDLESITQLYRLFLYPKFWEIILLYIYSNNLD